MSTENEAGRPGSPAADQQDRAAAVYRQPGSMGSTGPDEQIETDVERSAHNAAVSTTPGKTAGPGDAGGVPVTSAYPAEGTSESSPVAQGTRTPR